MAISRNLFPLCSIFLLIAGPLRAQEAEFPDATVLVEPLRTTANPFPVLASFEAPFPAGVSPAAESAAPGSGAASVESTASALEPARSRRQAAQGIFLEPPDIEAWYLIGDHRQVYACQLESIDRIPEGRTFDWARVTTLVPRRPQLLRLVRLRGPIPAGALTVSSRLAGGLLTLKSANVEFCARPTFFRVAEQVVLHDHTILPPFVENLVNRQQNVELVVTDTLRHADFPLSPQTPEQGFAVDRPGPVIASGLYRGTFAGDESVPAIPFEGRVGMTAQGLSFISVTLPAGGIDLAKYRVKDLHLTVPILLEESASLGFGSAFSQSRGRRFWKGVSRLTANSDGKYSFTDCDGSGASGSSGLCWADYASERAGLGIIWSGKAVSVEITCDHNEDLIDIRLAPSSQAPGAPVTAEVYLYFHTGLADRNILGYLADGLAHPPALRVSEEYVKAVLARD